MKKQIEQPLDWESVIKPLLEINEIGFNAARKIADVQSNYLRHICEANLSLWKALLESKDVKTAVERQLEFIKDVDTKWCDAAEEELATARDAQHSLNATLEKSYLNNADLIDQFAIRH